MPHLSGKPWAIKGKRPSVTRLPRAANVTRRRERRLPTAWPVFRCCRRDAFHRTSVWDTQLQGASLSGGESISHGLLIDWYQSVLVFWKVPEVDRVQVSSSNGGASARTEFQFLGV